MTRPLTADHHRLGARLRRALEYVVAAAVLAVLVTFINAAAALTTGNPVSVTGGSVLTCAAFIALLGGVGFILPPRPETPVHIATITARPATRIEDLLEVYYLAKGYAIPDLSVGKLMLREAADETLAAVTRPDVDRHSVILDTGGVVLAAGVIAHAYGFTLMDAVTERIAVHAQWGVPADPAPPVPLERRLRHAITTTPGTSVVDRAALERAVAVLVRNRPLADAFRIALVDEDPARPENRQDQGR